MRGARPFTFACCGCAEASCKPPALPRPLFGHMQKWLELATRTVLSWMAYILEITHTCTMLLWELKDGLSKE